MVPMYSVCMYESELMMFGLGEAWASEQSCQREFVYMTFGSGISYKSTRLDGEGKGNEVMSASFRRWGTVAKRLRDFESVSFGIEYFLW